MYCKNCGSQMPDGYMYCNNCGSAMNVQDNDYSQYQNSMNYNMQNNTDYAYNNGYNSEYNGYSNQSYNGYDPNAQYYNQNNAYGYNGMVDNSLKTKVKNYFTAAFVYKDKTKLAILCGSLAGVILFIVLVSSIFGGRSWKSTVEKYVSASINGNAKSIVNLFHPKLLEYVEDEYGYTKEDLIDQFYDEYEDYYEDLLSDYNISYKIVEVEKIKGSSLTSRKKEAEEMDIDNLTEAKEVEVKLTLTLRDDSDVKKTNSMYVTVVKIGNGWYLWR